MCLSPCAPLFLFLCFFLSHTTLPPLPRANTNTVGSGYLEVTTDSAFVRLSGLSKINTQGNNPDLLGMGKAIDLNPLTPLGVWGVIKDPSIDNKTVGWEGCTAYGLQRFGNNGPVVPVGEIDIWVDAYVSEDRSFC